MEYIPVANVVTEEEDAKAVYDVVKSGWISKGKKVDEFETKFAKAVNARHAIAVNSGTSAIHAVLSALEIGYGDEVIIPSLTFISTANAVLYQNATPILVECDPDTYNTTDELIEPAITSKTKAIIPVDMNGMPVDYDRILALGNRKGIHVIADSAESLGSIYKGKKVGSIAGIHCFSFFPNKAITTGEGGMITVQDSELSKKLRKIINQGQDGRYNHTILGYNYRMNDIQAALGIVQLSRLENIMSDKIRIVNKYSTLFKVIEGLKLPILPDYVNRHSWYMYAVQVDANIRNRIVDFLEKNNIQTRLSFPPIHIQPYYQNRFGYKDADFPISFSTWKRLIDLPIWPGLKDEHLEYIADMMSKALK